MSESIVAVRFLFVDSGEYREETFRLPSAEMDRYDRLIDWIREDPAVLSAVHVDLDRVCAVSLAASD